MPGNLNGGRKSRQVVNILLKDQLEITRKNPEFMAILSYY